MVYTVVHVKSCDTRHQHHFENRINANASISNGHFRMQAKQSEKKPLTHNAQQIFQEWQHRVNIVFKCLDIVRLGRWGHRFDKASYFCQHKIRLLLFAGLQLHCDRQFRKEKKKTHTLSKAKQNNQNLIPINALLIKGCSIQGIHS